MRFNFYNTKEFGRKDDLFFSTFFSHLISYPTPVNLNYIWSFGSLAGLMLVIQIVTGLFLSMHYTPHVSEAFESVEHIMRDVNNGWFLRYSHANGASMFFIIVYLHIFKGLYYKSYLKTMLWSSGVVIYILMMAAAFLGYVLPWGQMSFWGATVITNFFSAIPMIGDDIACWIWGGFGVNNATLNRFFSLHYLIPFVIAALSLVHIALLHEYGSTNPITAESVNNVDFHQYFWVKDLFAVFIVLFFMVFLVGLYPNSLGHPSNYVKANPLVTPEHIVPEWYFLPFYAILRSVPNKLLGVVLMGLAIVSLLLLPFIDNPVHTSTKFRYCYKFFFWFFISDIFILTWIGSQEVVEPYVTIGAVATIFYFLFLYVLIPFSTYIDDLVFRDSLTKN